MTKPLAERRLDFADADKVFVGHRFTLKDERQDYAEPRYITAGKLDGRMVMVVWTPRGANRRIISMKKCNAREQTLCQHRLD